MQGSVADVLGAAGPCPTVAWQGHEYKVGWPVPTVLARIELEIARAAAEECKALAGVLAADDAPDLRAILLARHHRVGGPLWNEAFRTARGVLYILWSCVQEHHPEFGLRDAEAMMRECPTEVEAATLIVAPDFTRLVGRATNAPPAEVEKQIAKVHARLAKRSCPPSSPPTAA
jgi:hypothetical protein